MSFSLATEDAVLTWDGQVSGIPARAVSEAEDALREQPVVGATPTGPWFRFGSPEHAWLVLRARAPQADVAGDVPQFGDIGDELPAESLWEAAYQEVLHPRDRFGRWREIAHKGLIVVPIGKPGSGKGTVGKEVARNLGMPHVSAGDMLRALPRDSELGRQVFPLIDRGNLVPDALISDLVEKRLTEDPSALVLDGFPRTVGQFDRLQAHAREHGRRVVYAELDLPDKVATDRLLKRAAVENRVDDTPEVIAHRMEVYKQQSAAVIDRAEQAGDLIRLKVDKPLEENVRDFGEALAAKLKLTEAYVERLHPRNRLGEWAKKAARQVALPATSRTTTSSGEAVPFRSAEHAEQWFQTRYPDKQFDFGGADIKLLGPALIHFDRLLQKYPVAARKWSGILLARPIGDQKKLEYELPWNAHAGVRKTDDMLLLNALQWGPHSELLKDMEKAELAEWHPPGAATPTAMLTHEFGHILDHALTAEGETKWRAPVGHDYGSVGDTWRAWIKDSDKTPVSGYAVQASRGMFDTVDDTERIAEAFSSMHHTPSELQDEFTQRMAMLLHDIADESKWSPLHNDDTIWFKGHEDTPRYSEEQIAEFQRERILWMAEHYGPLWTIRGGRAYTLPQAHKQPGKVEEEETLYKMLYGDEYQAQVHAMYDRRHAHTAELRDREQAKKKAEREAEQAAAEARRKAELDKWVPRREELKAQGLTPPEVLAKLKEEGFDDRLLMSWYDPKPPNDPVDDWAWRTLRGK